VTTRAEVREACRAVVDPCSAATGSNLDVVEMGLVKSIDLADGHVAVEMRLTTPTCEMAPFFVEEIEERVGALPDVESVDCVVDHGFEWTPDMMSEEAARRRRAVLDERIERGRERLASE
jgi:metal-sulfur cluster biosynthetic enzyme